MVAGAMPRHDADRFALRMRVRVETPAPPAWKGAIDENLQFFVCARIQAFGFGLFVLAKNEEPSPKLQP
jgi:hypothetical protein